MEVTDDDRLQRAYLAGVTKGHKEMLGVVVTLATTTIISIILTGIIALS